MPVPKNYDRNQSISYSRRAGAQEVERTLLLADGSFCSNRQHARNSQRRLEALLSMPTIYSFSTCARIWGERKDLTYQLNRHRQIILRPMLARWEQEIDAEARNPFSPDLV